MRRPAAMGAMMSPFLLLDEMGPVDYGPGEAVGAPSHPHRGFETVTYCSTAAWSTRTPPATAEPFGRRRAMDDRRPRSHSQRAASRGRLEDGGRSQVSRYG